MNAIAPDHSRQNMSCSMSISSHNLPPTKVSTRSLLTMEDRLRQIRHVALDMDGTIYSGDTLFDFTRPFLAQLTALGIGYTFLTNNSSKSVKDYVARLRAMGVSARCATGARSLGGSKVSERLIHGGMVTCAAEASSSV